jgi:signal transduction histidine kinase
VQVRWRCESGDRVAVLEIVDDGRGIGGDAPRRADAFGLVGMRERADAIGARLEVGEGPGGTGTVVRLELPSGP